MPTSAILARMATELSFHERPGIDDETFAQRADERMLAIEWISEGIAKAW